MLDNMHAEVDPVKWRKAVAGCIHEKLSLTIRASSARQAIWGFASAGPQKALKYAVAKAGKGLLA